MSVGRSGVAWGALGLLVVLLGVGVSACSEDGPTAEEQQAARDAEIYEDEMDALDEEADAAQRDAGQSAADERRDLLEQGLELQACGPAEAERDLACSFAGDVATVIDGDTVRLASGESVRLLGIDAPELTPAPECGAAAAKARLEALMVEGRKWGVQMVPAPLASLHGFPNRDQHGRLLRDVAWVGERSAVGDELVPQPVERKAAVILAREGLVRWADFSAVNGMERDDYLDATEEYRRAASAAKAAKRGGWGSCGWN